MLGALLLIVVVIAAVASVSVFLSQAQKNEQARSALLSSVQNENLQIVYAQFLPNNPSIHWELNMTGGPDYYVQFVNSTEVTLTQIGTPSNSFPAALPGGNTLMIKNGEMVTLSATPPPNCSSCQTITFVPGGFIFYSVDKWTSVIISVRNLNTAQASIYQIQVNSNWLSGWVEVNQDGSPLAIPVSGGPNMPSIIIPARATLSFKLDLVSYAIEQNDSMKITLLSTVGNYFTTNYAPPTPVVRSTTASENYQVVTRDIVTLDGSQSSSAASSIQSYYWQIVLPTKSAGCTDAAFSNPSNLDVAYATGETIQYLPESLFSATQLKSDCIAGPLQATLTVTDDNGFTSTSQPLLVSPDSNIAPIASISIACMSTTSGSPGSVTIQVNDIFGNPVNGVVVTAIPTAGVVTSISPGPAGTTASDSTCGPLEPGQVTFGVTYSSASAAVQFDTGALPPISVSFS